MSENKLDNLETEVHELIKLSQQLKEINDHLSKKNIELSKENNKLSEKLDIAKDGITSNIGFTAYCGRKYFLDLSKSNLFFSSNNWIKITIDCFFCNILSIFI